MEFKDSEDKNFNSPFIIVVGFIGQVLLWFRETKYTLHLYEVTSELKRKFLALFL